MDQLALASNVLDEQPFSRLTGARMTTFGDGTATLELDVADRLRQQHGLLHGRVLAHAPDNVSGSRPAPRSATACSQRP